MSDQEGRHAPRLERHFIVRYRKVSERAWHMSPLRDFSRDGARLVCEEAFQPGDQLELLLGPPLFTETVQMAARVVWQKPVFSGSLQMSEHGVSFTSVEPSLQQAIDEAVQRFLKQKPSAGP